MKLTPESGEDPNLRAPQDEGCANARIIPGESEEELNALRQGWLDDYEPHTQTTRSLVLQAAEAEWVRMRNVERYHKCEKKLCEEEKDFTLWSEAQHHQLQLALRYRTAAERSFSRALANLERLRGSRLREETQRRREQEREQEREKKTEKQPKQESKKEAPMEKPKTRGEETFQGQNNPKKMRKIALLEQWVEVAIEDGKTITKLYPSNEKLIEQGKTMLPPPELVYRRMFFADGIPPEYYWTTEDEAKRKAGGCGGIQRMTVDTWLDVIDEEKEGNGHLGTCGGNLPRPKERGGCECAVCVGNAKIFEEQILT